MKNINESDLIDKWKGSKILVAGNGPSLKCYSKEFYESFECSIGVNTISNTFIPSFIYDIERRPTKWKSPQDPDKLGAVWISSAVNKKLGISYIIEFSKKGRGVFPLRKEPFNNELAYGYTSTFGALHLAYLFGASDIYLIGIDFCLDPEGVVYHDGRERHKSQDWYLNIKDNKRINSLVWFKEAFRLLNGQGVKCYDLSPFGCLEGLPKVSSIS